MALLFGRLDEVTDIDFTGCDQLLSFKPLSEMDIDWKYPGHGNLSMGNTDLETVRLVDWLYFYHLTPCCIMAADHKPWKSGCAMIE